MVILSVDPGITGGYALFNVEGNNFSYLIARRFSKIKTPRSVSKQHYSIDVRELNADLCNYKPTYAIIERVSARPMYNKSGDKVQGEASTFAFGYNTASAEAIVLLHIEPEHITWVQPSSWKKHFDLIKKDKKESCNMAYSIFADEQFLKVAYQGPAEAALIGLYGIQKRLIK